MAENNTGYTQSLKPHPHSIFDIGLAQKKSCQVEISNHSPTVDV